jgi:hypothetical protein
MQNAGSSHLVSRRSVHIVLAIAGLSFSIGARADIVILTNDKVLEGKVTDDGETVTVEMSRGTVKVAKSKVKSIVQKDTPQDEYNRRVEDLVKNEKAGKLDRAADAQGWFELAQWAGKNDLTKARREALQRVLEIDPDHAGAREALGFVWYDNRWMTQTERYQAMGLVHVDGKWLPPEALKDVAKVRDEQRATQEREEQLRADTALKEAQARKLEAETNLLEAQAHAQAPIEPAPPAIQPLPVAAPPVQIIYLPMRPAYPFYSPFGPFPPPTPIRPLVPLQPIVAPISPDQGKPHKPHQINSTLNDGKGGPPMPVLHD